MKHTCHARNCKRQCRPQYLMCPPHWSMVPTRAKLAVVRNYRRGQCEDKRPSRAWMVAADAAIGSVALLEGCPPGKLLLREARAILALVPEVFGERADEMRRRIEEIDEEARVQSTVLAAALRGTSS